MAVNIKPAVSTVRRGRSPSFPFISLKAAISRLKQLEVKFGRHPVPFEKAGLAWKMKEGSSQTSQTLAALRAFGLLKYKSTEGGAVLTDDGRTYLQAQQEHIKKDIIREAALKPKEIAKYWGDWKADPPIDEVRLDELVLKAKYTAEGAKAFLKVYDATIAFAKLSPSDKNGSDSRNGEDEDDEGAENDSPDVHHDAARKRNKVKPGMNEDAFAMKEGTVILQWPDRLSQESYEDLEAWAQLVLRKIKRHIADDDEEPAN